MKVFIAGSCVTRDAFTPDTKKDFENVNYYARYSLARLIYPEVPLEISDKLFEQKVSSAFQRKLLKNEFSNNLIESILDAEFDYLVIDCVDERFGLIYYNQSSYVTNSDELRKAQLFDYKSALKTPCDNKEFHHFWRCGLKKIIDEIGVDKIIINNVYWTNKLNSGDDISTVENVKRCNKMVSNLYQIAKEEGIPENNFVNYPSSILIGDANHRWGPSPFHYIQDVYDYFINYMHNLKK
ncbi:DUF6270 domain-containing protein [Psychrobacter sp. FME5]|uniref:DUF6270 domain-containing protein n=1 Tax=Psychrobacter sp. FME5 TaxID=2487706 RepID=UPI0017884E71|nr:DUF6270 domain-containing protein [Psychrobacter sp. FME5]MBE0444158.1 hypothetical protein [Psychrobacter sp. FME5]